jgi:putative SOS response-associated peptidase YedK
MCNRYRMTAKQAEVAARFGVVAPYPEDLTIPPPELFPKNSAFVVREEDGLRLLDVMSWGFPFQTPGKTKVLEKRVTNVRNLESGFWRHVLTDSARRCLVPFTAFSEYGQTRGPDKKLPLHWFNVPSRPITSFAGIWRPLGDDTRAYAFLTCEPNSLVAPIHPKAMPVLLHQEDEQRWLDGELGELVSPFPAQLMTLDPA